MAARCGPPFFCLQWFFVRSAPCIGVWRVGVLYRKWRVKFFYAGRHCIVRI